MGPPAVGPAPVKGGAPPVPGTVSQKYALPLTKKSGQNARSVHPYRFSPGRNTRAAIRLKSTAAAMPPAVAVRPPVMTPSQPFSLTALATPLARLEA